MFDFHLHSSISHDSSCPAEKIIKRAEELGLSEICFTDHYDYYSGMNEISYLFDMKDYNEAYDSVSSEKVKVRKGLEFAITALNRSKLEELLKLRSFDFIIGSVHFIDDGDPYRELFWKNRSSGQALELYFQDMYRYVKIHDGFDVLGHLTYISKCPPNPEQAPVCYKKYSDTVDEIFRELIQKGIGLEVNTSGIDSCGVFLPDREYLIRFKELGGEIVTVGSDSHDEKRVGRYSKEALEMIKDIFGYVCTFENRKPIFHKL